MTHILLLVAASGLLVASRSQLVFPMGHLRKLTEPRRLATFVESHVYENDNCTKGEMMIKTAVGCSLIYHQAFADMNGMDSPLSIKTRCEDPWIKESIYLNDDCSGSPVDGRHSHRDECSSEDLTTGFASKKPTSCDAEHDAATLTIYADSACSKLLITQILWTEDYRGSCSPAGKYFQNMECHEDGSFTSTEYIDSNCTQKRWIPWDKYLVGACIPMRVDPDMPPLETPLWMKVEAKNLCATSESTFLAPSVSGTVHIAAFGGIAWLVAQCAMIFQ